MSFKQTLAAMLIACTCGVGSAAEPVLTYLQNPQNTLLTPQAITATPDNGFLVAGKSEWANARQAWAFKLNAAGEAEWRYLRDIPDAERMRTLDDPNGTAEFRSALAAPDGGALLCANTAYSRNGSNMFMTRLDREGHLVDEKFVDTQGLAKDAVYRIQDCIAWNGGAAVLAHEFHYPGPNAPLSGSSASYLLMMFNMTGQLQWRRVLPTLTPGFSPDPTGGIGLRATPQALLVSATDNMNTELLKFDVQGALVAQRVLNGRYLLLRNLPPDEPATLYGLVHGGEPQSHTLLTLADDLSDAGRIQSRQKSDFVSSQVQRMRDGSLLLFGFSQHYFTGRRADVLHLAGDLQSERAISPGYQKISDPLSISVACARFDGKGFAYAVSLRPAGWPANTNGSFGMVVGFLD
jgi:hypothetical protein